MCSFLALKIDENVENFVAHICKQSGPLFTLFFLYSFFWHNNTQFSNKYNSFSACYLFTCVVQSVEVNVNMKICVYANKTHNKWWMATVAAATTIDSTMLNISKQLAIECIALSIYMRSLSPHSSFSSLFLSYRSSSSLSHEIQVFISVWKAFATCNIL